MRRGGAAPIDNSKIRSHPEKDAPYRALTEKTYALTARFYTKSLVTSQREHDFTEQYKH